jgi:hypothetical protein
MLTNCKNKAIKLCFTVENKKYCTVGTAPKYNRKNGLFQKYVFWFYYSNHTSL